MVAMRLTSPNYLPEYGGKMPRNSVVDVDAETAKRWEKHNIAVKDDGADLPALDGDATSVGALQAQIERLQRDLEAAQARANPDRDLAAERASLRGLTDDGQPPSPFDNAPDEGDGDDGKPRSRRGAK